MRSKIRGEPVDGEPPSPRSLDGDQRRQPPRADGLLFPQRDRSSPPIGTDSSCIMGVHSKHQLAHTSRVTQPHPCLLPSGQSTD